MLASLAALAPPAEASPRRSANRDVLPLTRVRLYETGIGYFERSGRISASTRLPIPAAQLDDVLKSLVILDGAGSRLEGVRFDTRVTERLGRALAGLPTETDAVLDYEALARSLTGAQVALLVAGQGYVGRLLQVVTPEASDLERCLPGSEAAAQKPGAEPTCVARKEAALLLLRDNGELMRFGLQQLQSLRPLQQGDANRLRSAFTASAGGRGAQHELAVRGALSERVTLGYVAEAPLWRTTYRLVLAEQGALLQAWALLHNDSDEDWAGVKMELVNGQPDSFLFPLAAPRYTRRRLVTPESELSSVPQLLSRSADGLWEDGEEEGIGLGGVGTIGYGSGAGGFSGIGEGSARSGEEASSLLAIGDLAAHAAAVGEEIGAQFRYALASPVDLPAHDSLLVPLLTEPVSAVRISYFALGSDAAQSALLLHNSTKQTLPPGTLAIFEDGGFGGETAIDRCKPDERRLLPFGLDLNVELERTSGARREKRRAVRFEHGRLVEHFERVQEERYALRNRSRTARSVHIALDVVNNAKVEQADSLLVLEPGSVSAVFDVGPESARDVKAVVTEGLERRTDWAKLSAAALAPLARDTQLPQAQRTLLAQARDQLLERDRRLVRSKQLQSELALLKQKAERARKSLPIVSRADRERGEALAAELVRTEARLAENERARAEIDADAPLRAARATLMRLGAGAAAE